MNLVDPSGAAGPLRRLPPALKLAALFGVSLLLFALDSPAALGWVAGAVLAVSVLCCRAALFSWLRSWPLLLTIAVVVLWTAHADGLEAAAVVLARLGTLSLFATIVTATTTIGEFIETVSALARPLERVGIGNARDIGLAIGLVIRFVPEVHGRYRAVAEAHRARGLPMRPSTIVIPMVVGTLRTADEIANAIDARGLREGPAERT